jgi:hypothetical protein
LEEGTSRLSLVFLLEGCFGAFATTGLVTFMEIKYDGKVSSIKLINEKSPTKMEEK